MIQRLSDSPAPILATLLPNLIYLCIQLPAIQQQAAETLALDIVQSENGQRHHRNGMRRLLVITTIARTVEAFLLPFGRHFRGLGWQVDALAEGISGSQECAQSFDQVLEVTWSRNPLNAANLLVAPRQILRAVTQGNYDLVHVHTPVAAFVTRSALRFQRGSERPKIIYTAHGFHFEAGSRSLKNAGFLALEKIAGNWTDYLVIMNSDDRTLAAKHHLVQPDRIVYMPGIGLDTRLIAPENVPAQEVQAIRSDLGLSDKDVLFSVLAALEPRKRHRDVLHALGTLNNSSVHLALAGSGPLLTELKNLADQLGITKQVHFLGHCREVRPLIRASVATVLPSAREGLSRSVMESLSLATPVIGTNVKGIRDLLTDGGGLLVEAGDVAALARAMARLVEHPEEAKAMGERGRHYIADYDTAHILAMHEELYARALADVAVVA